MIHFDVETRGVRDLTKCGSHCYAMHPQTDVWCLCWIDTDANTKGTWLPGEPVPLVFLEPFESFCAWNAQFERDIHQYILVPRYDFPSIDNEQWHDTAAWARQMSLPNALERAASVLGLAGDAGKDAEGKTLMLQMAKPRSYTHSGHPIWWEDTPENLAALAKQGKEPRMKRLIEYCQQDVVVETEIRKILSALCEKI